MFCDSRTLANCQLLKKDDVAGVSNYLAIQSGAELHS